MDHLADTRLVAVGDGERMRWRRASEVRQGERRRDKEREGEKKRDKEK